MGNYLGTKLDADQVLRRAYDEGSNRLRVDAEISASIGDVILSAATSNIAISDGTDTLLINPDGSLNVNVLLNHADDSVRLGDGTNLFTGTVNGPKTGLDVNLINTNLPLPLGAATETTLSQIDTKIVTTLNGIKVDGSAVTQPVSVSSLPLPSGAATESTLNSLLTELQQKTEPSDVQNIRNLTSVSDSITVPGVASETTLGNINSKLNTLGQKTMTGSVPVVLASDQSSLPVSLTGEPIKMSGTIDGQPNGTEFTFVNNLRQQILASHDRQAELTYADFGTKDQRITQIDYTSATFPGTTVRKQFLYTLVSGKYRRDDINWILI